MHGRTSSENVTFYKELLGLWPLQQALPPPPTQLPKVFARLSCFIEMTAAHKRTLLAGPFSSHPPHDSAAGSVRRPHDTPSILHARSVSCSSSFYASGCSWLAPFSELCRSVTVLGIPSPPLQRERCLCAGQQRRRRGIQLLGCLHVPSVPLLGRPAVVACQRHISCHSDCNRWWWRGREQRGRWWGCGRCCSPDAACANRARHQHRGGIRWKPIDAGRKHFDNNLCHWHRCHRFGRGLRWHQRQHLSAMYWSTRRVWRRRRWRQLQ